MYISKLPTTESHWECGQFICIKSIRIVTARSRFEDSLRNIHFMDSTKGYKVTSLSFSNSVSNDDSQITDKHMVKFKGWWSIKQYVQNKPIKCYMVKHELRVTSWKLKSTSWNPKVRVQILELRVQIHELRVQMDELRVRIHEFKNHYSLIITS